VDNRAQTVFVEVWRLMQNPGGVPAVTLLACTDTVYELVLREFCISLVVSGYRSEIDV
jgi:hypothetical protein